MARHGENIFRRKDGRWEARVIIRRDGAHTYRSLYGATYTEAKAKKEDFIRRSPLPTDIGADERLPMSQMAELWLVGVRGTVKESTFTRYHRSVHAYLTPTLGAREITRLDSCTVNKFRDDLLSGGGRKGGGLSEKTVTDILSVLTLILKYAADEGYSVMNTSQIRCPRGRKKNISTIPEGELERLEGVLLESDDRLSLGILLTLHTGIRIGELCGLRWEDVHFDRGSIVIARTIERIAELDPTKKAKTKIVIDCPKTEASAREIPLPRLLCEHLISRRGKAGTYILTGTDKPSEPHTIYVRYRRLLSKSGFADYTFHALRHTFATRGIESGFDAKSLSEILGHADVTTTLRTYVHPSVEQKRKQMESLFECDIRSQKYGH